jgi:assimilatory nitrate reductase catalytic subunit
VRITRIELPWRLVAFGHPRDGDALALARLARQWLPAFGFATCVLVGGEREGVLFRAAASGPAEPRAIEALDAIFGLRGEDTLRYDDGRRGVGRRIRMSGGAIDAVRLAGDVGAEAWLRDLFDRQEAVANVGALLLAPTARLPVPAARGRTVCSCLNVSEAAICEFVAGAAGDADPLAALQSALKCGTQCGSCLPELKRLVATGKAAA